MALTDGRNTIQVANDASVIAIPMAAGAKIYEGGLVAVNATGYAVPATAAENLKAAGRAENFIDNTDGADGDEEIIVSRGVFYWDNDTTSPVTQAHVLDDCYIKDDETVTSDATGTSKAGKVLKVDADGVMVETI